MDLSDISKVENRKRINEDAVKLKEKISRESAKIIKLRVAQDTAHWDLKERLTGLQGEHERLQQNMLDVQMQHEALSAQYQDELRMRPETLNKLASTREICDVLEEYTGRVRASLRRAADDRDALKEAYASAARQVQAATTTAHIQATAQANKLRLTEERGAQLAECANDTRRYAEVAVSAAREQLQAAAQRAEQLQKRADGLQDRAASLHADLQQREQIIAELRQENERRAAESAAEMKRAEHAFIELQRELKERNVALGTVRDALADAEKRVAKSAEEASLRGDAIQTLENVVADLRQKLETASVANEGLQKKIQELEQEVIQIQARVEAKQGEVDSMRAELQVEREARARESATAGEAGLAAERALAERAETVARLMRDVAAEAEARARCNTALNNSEEQARALADKLKVKEEELAVQVKIAFDIRGEKERLQDIIRKMQGTIDNIQTEITREPPAAAAHAAAAASVARREPPEHDDNALPAPPKPLRQSGCIRPPPPSTDKGVFLTQRPRCTNDDLFHFSDSSMDGDALDTEITREPPAAAAHAAAAASVARREPPEHDDNALPAPPKPLRQSGCIRPPPPSTDKGVFLTQRPRCTNDDLFHFSDSSMDGDALDTEITREPPAAAAHAAAAASVARREPPEHDDNALPAPPKPLRQSGCIRPPPPSTDKGVFLTQRPRCTNDDLFHFSDSSMDGDALDTEITREPPAAAAHAAAAASVARREPPEHDDNALPAPPKPLRQSGCIRPPPPSTDKGVFLTQRPRCTNDDLFHFSDSSMDGDALDLREVNKRFEALSRGIVPPATTLNALKRRRHAEHPKDAEKANISLSQVKTELDTRARTFFRNKRLDSKPKKPK